jgi:hypothetical protein
MKRLFDENKQDALYHLKLMKMEADSKEVMDKVDEIIKQLKAVKYK